MLRFLTTLQFSALIACVMLASPVIAAPIFSGFEGDDAGGIGSADVMVSVAGNVLTLTLNNTSPTDLINGAMGNAPGITGFGFNLEAPVPTISGWTLKAWRRDGGGALEEVTIGANPDIPENLDDWVLTTRDDKKQIANIRMDYLPVTDGRNIKGALYNPDADPSALAAKPNYFTRATFVMTFATAPVLSSQDEDYFVRMQNVGRNGEGSLKLYGDGTFETPMTPMAESGSMALFAMGMACCSGWSARRRYARRAAWTA